jgi:guanine deaminase
MKIESYNDVFFLRKVIELAAENVQTEMGGPFAAVITLNNEILATATNLVTLCFDPTAHAEIRAIREACQILNTWHLEDCTIYSSCEPCPMCMGAIYWSCMKRLVFAADKHQAQKAGFDDAFIYKEILLPYNQRKLNTKQIVLQEDNLPFDLWINSNKKKKY